MTLMTLKVTTLEVGHLTFAGSKSDLLQAHFLDLFKHQEVFFSRCVCRMFFLSVTCFFWLPEHAWHYCSLCMEFS